MHFLIVAALVILFWGFIWEVIKMAFKVAAYVISFGAFIWVIWGAWEFLVKHW
jgi:hypothetical protein